MRVARFYAFLAVLIASLLPAAAFADGEALMGAQWRLAAFRGEVPVEGTNITMTMGGQGIISGSSGCNGYTAHCSIAGNKISIGEPASTKMVCKEPEGVMLQERAYLDSLAQIVSWRAEKGRAEFFSEKGGMVLLFIDTKIEPAIKEFEAGGNRLSAEIYPCDFMIMRVGGRSYVLFKTDAASGTRYCAEGDVNTFFWQDGSSAYISTKGDSYPIFKEVGSSAPSEAVQPAKGGTKQKPTPEPEKKAEPEKKPEVKKKPTAEPKPGGEQGQKPAPAPAKGTDGSDGWYDSEITGVLIKDIDKDRNRIYLKANAETFTMKRTEAATGERYVAEDDPTTVFWSWDGGASLMIRGRDYGAKVVRRDAEKIQTEDERTIARMAKAPWKVQSMGGKSLIENTSITMNFEEDGTLSGKCTVNSYKSSWALYNNKITIGRVDFTRKSGKQAVTEQEYAFFNMLDDVRKAEVGEAKLLLITKDGSKIVATR